MSYDELPPPYDEEMPPEYDEYDGDNEDGNDDNNINVVKSKLLAYGCCVAICAIANIVIWSVYHQYS